jgi:3-oxoacyl-[acyl-carrier protein] reductase
VAGEGGSRRVALITGVGRTTGIAAAVARRLAGDHDLMLTGLPSYDLDRGVGIDGEKVGKLLAELRGLGARVRYEDADLSAASAPAEIVESAVEEFGRVDALVAVHAHSSATPLGSLGAAEIDKHLIVNVRATLLLVEAFVRAYDSSRGQGRIVFFSSGQRLGPMPTELAYVASKGGIEALVPSLADSLAAIGIAVNALNPGPTDTGWLSGEDASWMTGQILDSEGGFRR